MFCHRNFHHQFLISTRKRNRRKIRRSYATAFNADDKFPPHQSAEWQLNRNSAKRNRTRFLSKTQNSDISFSNGWCSGFPYRYYSFLFLWFYLNKLFARGCQRNRWKWKCLIMSEKNLVLGHADKICSNRFLHPQFCWIIPGLFRTFSSANKMRCIKFSNLVCRKRLEWNRTICFSFTSNEKGEKQLLGRSSPNDWGVIFSMAVVSHSSFIISDRFSQKRSGKVWLHFTI